MTSTEVERPLAESPQWFVSWFDSIHYHRLYAYRDDKEAAGFIDELIRCLRPSIGATALDLACGTGRHSKYLASKGFRVTGIDLASSCISRAKQFEQPGLRFYEHDMRLPFGRNQFDYVFNFFTSFGYFEDPNENLSVIRNIAHSLKPGGRLVIDYLNVGYAESFTSSSEVRQVDGVRYRLNRWSNASHFYKRIAIDHADREEFAEYIERVAKFRLQDFCRMFSQCGMSIEATWGDYRLSRYDSATSPRLILMTEKRACAVAPLRDATALKKSLNCF
jgi:SAM-dependent methyltransferase